MYPHQWISTIRHLWIGFQILSSHRETQILNPLNLQSHTIHLSNGVHGWKTKISILSRGHYFPWGIWHLPVFHKWMAKPRHRPPRFGKAVPQIGKGKPNGREGKIQFQISQRSVGCSAVISSIQEENLQLKVQVVPLARPAEECRSCKNAGRYYEHNFTTCQYYASGKLPPCESVPNPTETAKEGEWLLAKSHNTKGRGDSERFNPEGQPQEPVVSSYGSCRT